MRKTLRSDLDNPKITIERVDILKRKKFLKNIYRDAYKTFVKFSKDAPKGKHVEIGSGAGFIKEIIPDTITSDIMKLPNCDLKFSAERMPFKDNSVSVFYMLNVFHHFKNPGRALREMQRCLKKNGLVIMVEPYNSIWGRFIYQNFHHESFNPLASWKTKKRGHLSGANGALPWIVFKRDLKIFKKKYPELRLKMFKPHTPLLYLLSGGFSHPQLLPDSFYPFFVKFEKKLSLLNSQIGMFVTIVLKKVS